MKVNTFDGGLSTRVDASLALPNEGVVYSNIDNAKLVLKSILDAENQSIEVTGYFNKFNSEWLSSTSHRTYVEYLDTLYYTEEGLIPKKYDGSLESQLGIVGPEDKLICVQAEPTASEKISASPSTLQYVYTYYNSNKGIESVPSPISDELSLDADKVVDITNIVGSDDPQVDQIRIYRIGDSITTMTLVDTIVNDTYSSVRDDTLTLDLPGSLLDSYDNYPPPTDGRYIIEAYGVFYMASGNKVYFSTTGKPDYWPQANFIQFAKTVTGILPIADGVLVFSRYKTDMIYGRTPSEFYVIPVSEEQGCIAHLSGKFIKSKPVWLSTDGLCLYENGYVSVISRDKLDKLSVSIINTAVYDEVYYILKTDGKLLAFDTRFNSIFKNIELSSLIQNIAVIDDDLYVSISNNVHKMFSGADLAFNYKSPIFTEGEHSNIKLYNNIYVRSNGTFTFKIYIDGELVLTKNLTGDKIHDVTPPKEKQRGMNIQFEITGIGTIYEYEYKVAGRENGR